jgi:hypothetical protein
MATSLTGLTSDSLANPNAGFALTAYIAGAQTTGAKKWAWLVPFDATIVKVNTYLDTAPTDASFIVDVNKNGTTIFTTQSARPTTLTTTKASTVGTPAVTTVAAGDRLTLDIDQIGSSVAGSDLYAVVHLKAAHQS